MEEKIMSLIVHSGEARSCAMEAISAAKEGGGEQVPMSLLMVHAQDHFMTSMTVKDLAMELIEVYKRL